MSEFYESIATRCRPELRAFIAGDHHFYIRDLGLNRVWVYGWLTDYDTSKPAWVLMGKCGRYAEDFIKEWLQTIGFYRVSELVSRYHSDYSYCCNHRGEQWVEFRTTPGRFRWP